MSWISSILSILKSFFSFLDKKTLTEDQKIARTKREEKKQVKNDWKDTQDEIDSAFQRMMTHPQINKAWEEVPEFTRDALKTISDQAARLELENIDN